MSLSVVLAVCGVSSLVFHACWALGIHLRLKFQFFFDANMMLAARLGYGIFGGVEFIYVNQ